MNLCLYSTYIAALRILIFPVNILKDEMVHNRLVCGLSSDSVHNQLLNERDLTLDKPVQVCLLNKVSERHYQRNQ